MTRFTASDTLVLHPLRKLITPSCITAAYFHCSLLIENSFSFSAIPHMPYLKRKPQGKKTDRSAKKAQFCHFLEGKNAPVFQLYECFEQFSQFSHPIQRGITKLCCCQLSKTPLILNVTLTGLIQQPKMCRKVRGESLF